MVPNKLVLASSSPRREELLQHLGLDFTIVPSKIDEEQFNQLPPQKMVCDLSAAKAEDISDLVEDTIIIAADTIVVKNDKKIGKPDNAEEAREILEELQGEKHQVLTGIAVLSTINDKIIVEHDVTEVYMRELSESQINNYVKTGEPLDKAGSYGIQGLGGIFIEKIKGSYFTVVGLPIHKLDQILSEFCIDIL